MKPQTILSAYIILFCQTALSKTGNEENQRLITKIKNECGYSLSKELTSKITQSTEIQLNNNGATIELSIDEKNFGKRELIIKFNCHPQNYTQNKTNENSQATPTSASEVIKEQDSGGRYGRHIASETKIYGPNWRGTAAHVDYIVGDNTKLLVTQIIACEEILSSPCIEMNVTPPLNNKTKIHNLIKIIEKISIRKSQKPPIKNHGQLTVTPPSI